MSVKGGTSGGSHPQKVAPYLNRIEIGANYHARMSMSKSMQLSKHMTKHKQYNPAV